MIVIKIQRYKDTKIQRYKCIRVSIYQHCAVASRRIYLIVRRLYLALVIICLFIGTLILILANAPLAIAINKQNVDKIITSVSSKRFYGDLALGRKWHW
jgi:hypothetical protein